MRCCEGDVVEEWFGFIVVDECEGAICIDVDDVFARADYVVVFF